MRVRSDETRLARKILAILDDVGRDRPEFERAAESRGIRVNQLVAAALAGMVVESRGRPARE